ncbi:sugar transporter [Xylaria grammica]|nr:sugar transporter [Xylaria grammica]
MAFLGLTGDKLAIARICLIVVPAFLFYGYNQSNLGGVLDYPSFTQHFPGIDTTTTSGAQQSYNAQIQGTVVAIYTLGCLFGSLGIAPVGNRFGRRKSLIIAAAIASLGIVLQASSYSLGQLIAGRILCGLGNGGVNSVVPVWQSECAKTKSRGKNVVIIGIFITSGVAAAGWTNVGLSYVEHLEVAWRLPLVIPLIFTIMIMSFTLSFPESPRWLISKGRIEEARENMILLSDEPVSYEAIDEDIAMISSLVTQDTAKTEKGFSSFFKPNHERLFYRLSLSVIINFYAQMTGANVISYYGKTIFKESLHLSSNKASFLNAGVLTFKIVAATSAFITVDRLGRKPLFLVACGGMSLSMAGLAGTVWAIDNAYTFGVSVAAVFFLFFFMAFFPLGFVGANFLYGAEIAPQDLRIHLAAVGTATHWLFNFVIAEITPVAFVTIKWRYYIVYAVIAFSALPVIYFLFPETKGLSLEDMNRLFSEPAGFAQIPAYARKIRKGALAQQDNEAQKNGLGVDQVEDISKS